MEPVRAPTHEVANRTAPPSRDPLFVGAEIIHAHIGAAGVGSRKIELEFKLDFLVVNAHCSRNSTRRSRVNGIGVHAVLFRSSDATSLAAPKQYCVHTVLFSRDRCPRVRGILGRRAAVERPSSGRDAEGRVRCAALGDHQKTRSRIGLMVTRYASPRRSLRRRALFWTVSSASERLPSLGLRTRPGTRKANAH